MEMPLGFTVYVKSENNTNPDKFNIHNSLLTVLLM